MAEDVNSLQAQLESQIAEALQMLDQLQLPAQRQTEQQAAVEDNSRPTTPQTSASKVETTGDASKDAENEFLSIRKELLSGKTNGLPTKKSNVFRIFMSSTFTDMALERNALMSLVFPELKKYCKERYNHEFQVVDMRWGVQDQASDDHSTSELCINELRNCQKESAGPTFVCLLGDRYGTRFLRKYIPSNHWAELLNYIEDQQVLSKLNTWYKRDDNSSPAHYVLQSISSVADGQSEWKKDSDSLYQAVKEAAIRARTAGDMTEDTAQIYIRSVTEEEIEESTMFKKDSPYRGFILACFRSLADINNSHNKAWRFIDQDNQKNVDTEAQELLAKLKDKVKQSLPADQQLDYKVNWSNDGGMNEIDHSSYLKQFSEEFKQKLIEMIDKSMTNQSLTTQVLRDDIVSQEVATHLQQAVSKCAKVVPRSDILDQIKDYVCGTSTSPLVVYGHSGCGKTSIMALSALKMSEWLVEGEMHLVLRFLGTTPASSDFELMVQHIRAQMESLMRPAIPPDSIRTDYLSGVKDINDLLTKLQMTLNTIQDHSDTKFVIILDSVDQLRENKMAYDLSWLPAELPQNVKLIISTLPDLHGILKSARSLPIPDNNFVEVKALDEKGAWSIIDFWLQEEQKQLTDTQRESISEIFHDRHTTPLYVKLIYDIIYTWKSYTPVTSLPADIFSCLEELFNRVETVHGELQVKHALGYITRCPGGVSQVELEDILSLDDVYLTTVYQYHIPPVRRIPPLLWVRIRSDLSDYLVEKESDGVAAMNWYHRQFLEYAEKRFIDSAPEKSAYYTDVLKEYFEGKWASLEKPFTYNERQMKKLGVSDPNSKALRYVDPQTTRSGADTYNLRKIYVLNALYTWTQYLPHSDKQQTVETAAINLSKILMDLEFLTGRFVYGSLGPDDLTRLLTLIQESSRDLSQLQYKDLTAVERLYAECKYLLSKLQLYYSKVQHHARSLPVYLFHYFKDKVNATPHISLQESRYPNLSWLLNDIVVGSGVDLCPLVNVALPIEDGGGGGGDEMVISREMSDPCFMCRYVASDGSTNICAVNGRKSLVIFKITDTDVMEVADIPLTANVIDAIYIPPGTDSEEFILGVSWVGETFVLVSLKTMKQIPSNTAEKVKVKVPNLSYKSTLEAEWCVPIRNPWLTGKDSILFLAAGNGLAVLFSYKADSVVWYRYTTANCRFQHIDVRDTEQVHVKHLVATLIGKTEIYKLELLEDGSVNVLLMQTIPNCFHKNGVIGKVVHARLPNFFFNGLSDRHVNVCVRGTNTSYIAITGKYPSTRDFVLYPIARNVIFLPAGSLKSGTQLVVAHDDPDPKTVLELYSILAPNLKLKLSARFNFPDGKVFMAHVAPSSNVLGLQCATSFHLYYLEELDDANLRVTAVYTIELVPESESCSVVDVQLDPYGYLICTTGTDVKVIDVTVSGSSNSGTNPYIKSGKSTMHSLMLPTQSQVAVVLQDVPHLWNVETNEWMGKLDRVDSSDRRQAQSLTCQPIEAEEGSFYITVDYETIIEVYKINVIHTLVTTELLHTIPSERGAEAIPFTTALLALNEDSGLLKIWRNSDMEKIETYTLTASLRGRSFSACDLYPLGYCYAEDFLIVSGSINSGSKDIVLIYDCNDEFKLVKQLMESFMKFIPNTFIYVKCLNTVIGNSGKGLFWKFDCKTKNQQMAETLQYEDINLLENYDRMHQPFMVKDDPEIHLVANHTKLISLDVRRFSDWPTGGGVVEYEGPPLTGVTEAHLSYHCNYLLTSSSGSHNTDITLYKLYGHESDRYIKLLGHYTIPTGLTDEMLISYDERYVTAILHSGEVHCMKILDKERNELLSETQALLSRFPRVPYEDEIDEDDRWKSIKACKLSEQVVKTKSYLEDGIKRLIVGKEAYPVIGTEEFASVHGDYTPLIITEPLSQEENQRLHEEGMKIYEKSLPYLSEDMTLSTTNTDNTAVPSDSSYYSSEAEKPSENQLTAADEQQQSNSNNLTGNSVGNSEPTPHLDEQLPDQVDVNVGELTTKPSESKTESNVLENAHIDQSSAAATVDKPTEFQAVKACTDDVQAGQPSVSVEIQLQDEVQTSAQESVTSAASIQYSQPFYNDLPADSRDAILDGVADDLSTRSRACILL